eukprot:TRINITY_DN6410_c0_g1_i1.p1 TRINITY_DN6410_c0_g1~~TRINITY_DN6410_c0_g1_i1.p1  ORF type:complete len:255 (-),score=83.64 TRINITY_DN6410_c0_g1_i1:20-784(-)
MDEFLNDLSNFDFSQPFPFFGFFLLNLPSRSRAIFLQSLDARNLSILEKMNLKKKTRFLIKPFFVGLPVLLTFNFLPFSIFQFLNRKGETKLRMQLIGEKLLIHFFSYPLLMAYRFQQINFISSNSYSNSIFKNINHLFNSRKFYSGFLASSIGFSFLLSSIYSENFNFFNFAIGYTLYYAFDTISVQQAIQNLPEFNSKNNPKNLIETILSFKSRPLKLFSGSIHCLLNSFFAFAILGFLNAEPTRNIKSLIQ